jgi:phage terminase large subunit
MTMARSQQSSSASSVLKVNIPVAFGDLIAPARYKGAYGGRGGAKSHFFAEQLVLLCFGKRTRAVCIREVQHTLRESVRELLVAKIQTLGLGEHFEVLEAEIRGRNGSLIIFRGMQTYNAENIKSLEDFDVAWVEEAQTLSDRSLRLLRPTIRNEGSELWFSWNPRHDSDPVDKFFRSGEKRKNAILVPVNWYDNPWFPAVLREEKDQDYADDPEMAEHVWGGGYEVISQGAYYARRIAEAEKDGRLGYFPHLPQLPVYTAWDIGVDDYTAIWFCQVRHLEDRTPRVRVIDYYEASGAGADEIIAAALPEYSRDLQTRAEAMVELGRDDPFSYGRHFWPHDVRVREWGSGAKSRVEIINSLGIPVAQMALGVAQNPEERIAATRALLPVCEFLQSKRVMLGLSRLRRYSRKINEALGVYMGPLHDENSHGADAFGEFAVNCGIRPVAKPKERLEEPPPGYVRAPPVPVRDPSRIVL